MRCTACDLVYVNPTGGQTANYFDIDGVGQHSADADRHLLVGDFECLLAELERAFAAEHGRPPSRVLLVGRYLHAFESSPIARRLGVRIVAPTDSEAQSFRDAANVAFLVDALHGDEDIVVLNEFLEGTSNARVALEGLRQRVGLRAWVAVTYANIASFPARILRRYWPHFFDRKSAFFNAENLGLLFHRAGYDLVSRSRLPGHYSPAYVAERLGAQRAASIARRLPIGGVPLPSGVNLAIFRRRAESASGKGEVLSIILPIFNEARYARDVLEAVIAKDIRIEKEIIVVESNSTDGTREIVRSFDGRPGIRTLYEERARGKGRAVRTGLAAATGSIVLIQDSDFEYDLDDYDALIEPILQRRTSFVLGSRSLGLDDWKVRRYPATPVRGLLMNLAQVGFAKTFNALYQQDVTDVNTMFKVFRRECLTGITLESDGFNLDIELACKIVKNGYAPMEVPVNYVSRGFDEGKKIDFWRDAWPSYLAFFKHRFEE